MEKIISLDTEEIIWNKSHIFFEVTPPNTALG